MKIAIPGEGDEPYGQDVADQINALLEDTEGKARRSGELLLGGIAGHYLQTDVFGTPLRAPLDPTLVGKPVDIAKLPPHSNN